MLYVRWKLEFAGGRLFVILGMNAITAYVFAELLAIALGGLRVHLAGGGRIGWGDFVYMRFFMPVASPAGSIKGDVKSKHFSRPEGRGRLGIEPLPESANCWCERCMLRIFFIGTARS